jgi:hypothetical protein
MPLGSSPNRRLTKDERQSPAIAEAAASAPSCHGRLAQHDPSVDRMSKAGSQQPREQEWGSVGCVDEYKALKDR